MMVELMQKLRTVFFINNIIDCVSGRWQSGGTRTGTEHRSVGRQLVKEWRDNRGACVHTTWT